MSSSGFWSAVALALAAAAVGLAACGDEPADSGTDSEAESSHPPAKPPPGWRVVRNRRAGFTLSAPRTWSARTSGPATLIRSDDQLVSITVAADRTAGERARDPAAFARKIVQNLPGFHGRVPERTGRVPGSRYRNARVDAHGRLSTSRVAQRITTAVFQRRGLVTYALLVFRNARVRPHFNDPVVERMLRSFRAQAPGFTP